jgi:DNA-binding SARP family transcriptional activator
MKLNELVAVSYQTFTRYTDGIRVVLLHPKARYRSMLVAKLINEPQLRTLYYTMGPDDIDVPALLVGLTHMLTGQHPTFGRNLNLMPTPTAGQDFRPWLEALAADLAEWTTEPFLFILDEYDRTDSADDIQRFIEALIPLMPPHGKLVLNSRSLPRFPWTSLIARNQAVILNDDRLVTDDFYGIEAGDSSRRLNVTALGPGYVAFNDTLITSWEGHLPRLLFFFALDRPTVPRAEICQAFWPELDLEQAVNVFHVTKRRLHKALGEDVLVHEGGYYCVNPALTVHYDVMDFVGALIKARTAQDEARIAYWQQAIDIYKGPFLQGHDDPWIVSRRMDFRSGYLEAITEMAESRQRQGYPEHALRLYLRALGEDNTRQDIHRRVMTLYAELGRRSEAAAHFQRTRRDLESRGLQIDEETRAVLKQVMS